MGKKKEAFIQIRITEEEKKRIKKAAKNSGFDSVSAFMLWHARKASKEIPTTL